MKTIINFIVDKTSDSISAYYDTQQHFMINKADIFPHLYNFIDSLGGFVEYFQFQDRSQNFTPSKYDRFIVDGVELKFVDLDEDQLLLLIDLRNALNEYEELEVINE